MWSHGDLFSAILFRRKFKTLEKTSTRGQFNKTFTLITKTPGPSKYTCMLKLSPINIVRGLKRGLLNSFVTFFIEFLFVYSNEANGPACKCQVVASEGPPVARVTWVLALQSLLFTVHEEGLQIIGSRHSCIASQKLVRHPPSSALCHHVPLRWFSLYVKY